jgi:signal transduction histidine kinase
MFKNLRTSTKLLVLCCTFLISIGVPVYALVTEMRIAIDFARKELAGSRYLAAVRATYAAMLVAQLGDEGIEGRRAPTDAVVRALDRAEAETGGALQTRDHAQSLAAALRELESRAGGAREARTQVLVALAKAQALAARVGDDSKLALDPDLDTYYVQGIVVRKLPTLLGRLSELQELFETSVADRSSAHEREVRLPILAGLIRSTAAEVMDNIETAYRGNADGSLKRTVHPGVTAMTLSVASYLEAVSVSTLGVDARDAVAYNRLHESAARQTIETWAVLQTELDRLLLRRIDGLLERMALGLALIGALAGISILIAVLTHRHIVRPLERLEAVASTVRETKDYSLRAEYGSQDEIGRVTAAFNDMLSELAAARARETAERAELARVSRLTTMGAMAASIAHEVNQPLAAIVTSGNAGLRWLAHGTPDLNKVQNALQRVVSDGLRASEIIGGVRAMFKKDVQERAPLEIYDLATDVVAFLRSELLSEQISVQLERGGDVAAVLGSRVQLQQVLLNLMTNAIDGMRPVRDRPRMLRICVGAGAVGEVAVRVEDSGSGIDPGLGDRVFDPFVTTKSGGMGLGLAICRSIIESHGGNVSVSAGDPHGSVFQFVLPASKRGGAQ